MMPEETYTDSYEVQRKLVKMIRLVSSFLMML